jgi:hypothetical protein
MKNKHQSNQQDFSNKAPQVMGNNQEEQQKEKKCVECFKCGEFGHYTNKCSKMEDKMTNLAWETSAFVTYYVCSIKKMDKFLLNQVLLDNQRNINIMKPDLLIMYKRPKNLYRGIGDFIVRSSQRNKQETHDSSIRNRFISSLKQCSIIND